MNNEIDARKLLILQAVIDEYIETNEPVGSRTIAKNHDFGISSATIRNEMADLEDMGLLSSPHTSAGRVPSTKGYRMYVDKIMKNATDNPDVANEIVKRLEGKMSEYSKTMKACTEIISEMTQYIAIGVTPGRKSFIIKAIQIVPIDDSHVLTVIVADKGAVKNQMVTLTEPITADKIIELSAAVNNHFSGRPADNISLTKINEIAEFTGISRNTLLPVMDGILDCVKQCEAGEIYTKGASKLLKCPEFDDIEKARGLIDMIQDEKVLQNIIKDSGDIDGVSVTIGTENTTDGMNEYSVVTAKYAADGVPVGTVSVVGPTRMDYQKVIASLEYMRKLLEEK